SRDEALGLACGDAVEQDLARARELGRARARDAEHPCETRVDAFSRKTVGNRQLLHARGSSDRAPGPGATSGASWTTGTSSGAGLPGPGASSCEGSGEACACSREPSRRMPRMLSSMMSHAATTIAMSATLPTNQPNQSMKSTTCPRAKPGSRKKRS